MKAVGKVLNDGTLVSSSSYRYLLKSIKKDPQLVSFLKNRYNVVFLHLLKHDQYINFWKHVTELELSCISSPGSCIPKEPKESKVTPEDNKWELIRFLANPNIEITRMCIQPTLIDQGYNSFSGIKNNPLYIGVSEISLTFNTKS